VLKQKKISYESGAISRLIETQKRSIMKTMTWRFLATATTFVISWLMTGSVAIGLGIAGIEFWAKIVLYYLHERAWSKINV